MNITEEYLDLMDFIAGSIDIPAVSGIHLPKPVEHAEKPDDFGFVFLQDGSVGPFYTGFDGSLEELWQHYPDGRRCSPDTMMLIQFFASESLALRSIALGAINAVSQHVMRLANYSPADSNYTGGSDIYNFDAGGKVCMVGCFDPLIEKFLQQNTEVLVLEKNPGRVELRDGVSLSTNPADLSSCKHILCTASTLINGTLENILAVGNNTKSFSLIGPSGSGLPDILFKYGVDDVGGVHFHDLEALQAALDVQESWGHTGKKYQITPEGYPGISALLKVING